MIAGADHSINPDSQRAAAARMGATTVEIEGGSHSIALSQPARVAGVVIDAVSAVAGQGAAARGRLQRSAIESGRAPPISRLREPTLASTWQAVAGSPIGDELLEWPPDVFALTDVILERAEAYRFVLSPPDGVLWPPGRRRKLERRGRAGSATVECVGRGSGWCGS